MQVSAKCVPGTIPVVLLSCICLLVFKTKNLKLYIFLATVLFFFLNFQKRKKTMNLATLSFADKIYLIMSVNVSTFFFCLLSF